MHVQCERIRKAVENFEFRYSGKSVRITTSLGFHLEKIIDKKIDEALVDLIHKADQALYLAKKEGRNLTMSLLWHLPRSFFPAFLTKGCDRKFPPNEISRPIFDNAAAVISGVVLCYRPEEVKSDNPVTNTTPGISERTLKIICPQ